MKKLLGTILVLICVSLLFLTACSTDKDLAQDETSEPPEVESSLTKEEAFDLFETLLGDSGYSFKKAEIEASSVGAKYGCSYKIKNGTAEIYLFDKDSEAYKTAERDQAVCAEGGGTYGAVVKDGAALVISLLDDGNAEMIETCFDTVLTGFTISDF